MNRLLRINIDAPSGYKQTDFLSIVRKRMPKSSMVVEKGAIVMRMYNLGAFKKNDKVFSAWGMRFGKEISIFIQEVKDESPL